MSAGHESPVGTSVAPGARTLAVVKRGHSHVFLMLAGTTGAHADVALLWDRREGDRRVGQVPAPGERRLGERRRPTPSSWHALGFVIVDREESACGHPVVAAGR